MPETIVWSRGAGAPYSKGLMAQSLSASGIPPERAWALARIVERRLAERGHERIGVAELDRLTEEVIRSEAGDPMLRRFLGWRRLDRLERPLIVAVAGTTGVGKSTLATMLAHRLGITRLIATDTIRQVLRAYFTQEAMPTVHHSAFEAGRAVEGVEEDADLVGFERQAARVGTGVAAIVERACLENTPMVIEGVHVVPGGLPPDLQERCMLVEALVTVGDEELHRGHLERRAGERPAERYLAGFPEIRKLQRHLTERALAASVPVIENAQVDQALAGLMELVLDEVAVAPEARGSRR